MIDKDGPEGELVADSCNCPANPLMLTRVMLKAVEEPAAILRDMGEALTPKSLMPAVRIW